MLFTFGTVARALSALNPWRCRPMNARPEFIQRFRRNLQAKYDAVQTTDENERHWANADGLSARMAANPGVRRTFRNRTRYEVINNSYASGIVQTLANHTIGTGPRLQVTTKDPAVNEAIETQFKLWARRVRLAEKLRTMRMSRCVDGESFAILGTNPRLIGPVQLDLQLVEADQITTPYLFAPNPQAVDGVEFDTFGNPIAYHKLKYHPGDMFFASNPFDVDRLPAEAVIHLFRADRPGQARGIPELAPALPLFAMLRRFTLATVAAAETAADFAAVLYTDAGPDGTAEVLPEDKWFDAIPVEYRAMLTLPNGWKMGQFKAEHPNSTYDMFKRSLLQEIARCLNMPYNIAAGDSSTYNYSSGRLDHQTYFRSIEVDQSALEVSALDRIFMAWLDEATLIPGLVPDELGFLDELPHQWFWDAIEDIDPEKTASAAQIGIGTGTTSRTRVLAEAGLDIDEEDAKAAESYGVTVEEYRRALFESTFSRGAWSAPPDQSPADARRFARQVAQQGATNAA